MQKSIATNTLLLHAAQHLAVLLPGPLLPLTCTAAPALGPAGCSQCVQAAQITFEDFFLADLAIPPLKIVGYEGVLGAATMLLLVLPIVQASTHAALFPSAPCMLRAVLMICTRANTLWNYSGRLACMCAATPLAC